MKKILVAGGAGYIGSHTMVELIAAGYDPVCVDNLYNSSPEAIRRVEKIAGKKIRFYQEDLTDRERVLAVFGKERPDAVIMFAGYKAVGQSVEKPLEYYYNNLLSLMNTVDACRRNSCKNLVFSSSATVYGDPEQVPLTEESPLGELTNPYGRTKSMIERILTDVRNADPEWNVVLLRYFNPIGAHPSGLIGEDPCGIPNNLVPYVAQTAIGLRKEIHVFGNDYDTPDGTGVRDYIHVVDLARGHVAALKTMEKQTGFRIYNLGTGKGYSVLEVIRAFEKACGKQLPYVIDSRRSGDIAVSYCDPSKAERETGWKAQYGIDEMCRDSWRWQSMNPSGYGETEHPGICLQ